MDVVLARIPPLPVTSLACPERRGGGCSGGAFHIRVKNQQIKYGSRFNCSLESFNDYNKQQEFTLISTNNIERLYDLFKIFQIYYLNN